MCDDNCSVALHPWRMPQPFHNNTEILDRMYPLKVFNSLTRTKVRFIPKDPSRVLWYQCGPTVYAESHIGHARTYVSLDVIRRIAKDYLGYNIVLCQNVTDIDDKIIIRSYEQGIPFRDLASKFEAEFFEDMAALGVQLPDLITRVSEYMPEILSYIDDLIKKGIAYEANGSVYFNTAQFQACGHKYGKLLPEQIGNSDLLAEGEGALTANDDKKNPSDFVLWKKMKTHENGMVEPSWESPWGAGRPGWHIECSVMCRAAFQKLSDDGCIDVHAGGIDLKFPHHENEVAQSEGHLGCNQWVNYWLHTGHLNIKGFKMSKSLKNFITIRQALESHTPRQIRLCFLLHKYNAPMDYGDSTMAQSLTVDRTFVEYFHNVKAIIRRLGVTGTQHVGEREITLLVLLQSTKEAVRAALLDDFDTPRALLCLQDLVRGSNRYVEDSPVVTVVLAQVARYITSVLRCFGLVPDASDIGFPLESSDNGGLNKEQVLSPILDALTKFRETVRIAAITGDNKAVLSAADDIRDNILPDLGIRMEDKGSGAQTVTVWKLDDPEVLKKEKQQKEDAKHAKELQKEEQAKKQREKEEKSKIPPETMFLSQTDLYSAFDESGLPSHDMNKEPLAKSIIKKLKKEMDKQKELHDAYLLKVNNEIDGKQEGGKK
eukprot:gene7099-14444_t